MVRYTSFLIRAFHMKIGWVFVKNLKQRLISSFTKLLPGKVEDVYLYMLFQRMRAFPKGLNGLQFILSMTISRYHWVAACRGL